MAKGNQASFAKRQREAAKRIKQQEKLQKRAARRVGETADDVPAEQDVAAADESVPQAAAPSSP